jgi:hypothetical protein
MGRYHVFPAVPEVTAGEEFEEGSSDLAWFKNVEEHSPQKELMPSSQEQNSNANALQAEPEFPVYDRYTLLALGKCMASLGDHSCQQPSLMGLITMKHHSDIKTRSLSEENPLLDDEKLITALEVRLSQESGADLCNSETFGDSSRGWTFEEALEANRRIQTKEVSEIEQVEQQQAHVSAHKWSCNAVPFTPQCVQPYGRADEHYLQACVQQPSVTGHDNSNSLLSLRERGRQLLDAMEGHIPPKVQGPFRANRKDQFYPNPHAYAFYSRPVAGHFQADTFSYEPMVQNRRRSQEDTSQTILGTKPAALAAPLQPTPVVKQPLSQGFRADAPSFEPGAPFVNECVSTDDGKSEGSIETVGSDGEDSLTQTSPANNRSDKDAKAKCLNKIPKQGANVLLGH